MESTVRPSPQKCSSARATASRPGVLFTPRRRREAHCGASDGPEALLGIANWQLRTSLNNVTPADAYFGRAPAIIKQRERIKRQTIEHRRLQHRKLAA